MKEPKWKIGKVQVFLTKSGSLLKLPLIVLIAFSTLALVALGWAEIDMQRRTEDLRAEAAVIQHENEELKQYTEDLGSIKSVERIAQEELGMVVPGTVLIEAQVK